MNKSGCSKPSFFGKSSNLFIKSDYSAFQLPEVQQEEKKKAVGLQGWVALG